MSGVLAAALGALRPVRPLFPLAILADNSLARLRVARRGDHERILTRLATALGSREQLALAALLPTAAGRRALGPLRPKADRAVLWLLASALSRSDVCDARVARLDGLQRPGQASGAVRGGVDRNVPIALPHTGAAAAAMRPIFPLRKHTITVLNAGRQLGADMEVLPQAADRLPAAVRLHEQRPGAGRESTVASGRAVGPVQPLAPRGVNTAFVALLSVARRNLALHFGFALSPAVLGRPLHDPAAPLLPTAASLGTRRPGLPIRPDAIDLVLVAHDAARDLGQRAAAALALRGGRPLEDAHAGHRAFADGDRALRPIRPGTQETIHDGVLARVVIADRHCLQRQQWALAAVLVGGLQCSLPVRLAAEAGLGAVAPFSPLRDLAIHDLGTWNRGGLHQCLLAGQPGALRRLQDVSAPLALAAAGRRPVRPAAELAVLLRTLLDHARLRLQQVVIARAATMSRLDMHLAHAGVPALATACTALRPLSPRGELAVLPLRPATWASLSQVPLARGTVDGRLMQNST
mmetsp:Transcript_117356/g.373954  ORF Transcript_117356/g.373954 Transcript_117356/m.373954 type:complete len:524 (+) Transcript_117356:2745-4316(+)